MQLSDKPAGITGTVTIRRHLSVASILLFLLLSSLSGAGVLWILWNGERHEAGKLALKTGRQEALIETQSKVNKELEENVHELRAKVKDLEATRDAFKKSSNFYDWPTPKPNEQHFFYIVASILEPTEQREEPKASYHIVFDLVNKTLVPMRSTGTVINEVGIVMERRREGNEIVSQYQRFGMAEAILDSFGVKFRLRQR
ncbi:MAG TPA: hypothetical protein VEC13_02910 [Candidatus Paceibacterota bacterium]|nr:hypothetical protein [Candidatus Paceibacterota bacterium]